MAINWNQLLQTLSTGVNAVNSLASNPSVQTLTGLGLTGAGLTQKEEPGFAVEARQFLRNRLAPQGIANQFTANLGPLSAGFQPYLNQLRERGIADVSQRYAAAFPSTVGAQGSEFGALSRYITDEALPREQALLSSLGLSSLETGGAAAGKLLDYAKPDPLGEYLATLGLNLLPGQGGQTGTGTAAGTTGTTGNALGSGLSQLLQNPTQLGQLSPIQLAQQILATGGTGELASLFASGALGGSGASGIPWLLPNGLSTLVGVDEAVALTQAGIGGPAASSVAGAGGGGAAGLGAALGPLAAGAAGGVAGYMAAPWLTEQANSDSPWRWLNPAAAGAESLGANDTVLSAITGAQAGAVAGTLILPGIGTAIGAVVGGIGGLFGGHKASLERKATFHTEDLNSQKDQTLELGNIGASFLERLGADPSTMSAWSSYVTQQSSIDGGQTQTAVRLGQVVLAQVQQRDPSITSLSQVPGMKDEFIDYMTRNTFTSGNSAYGGGPPLNFIGAPNIGAGGQVTPWTTLAGLAHGGYAHRRMNALVGERGPELVHLEPGSYVVPLSRN